MSPGQGAYGNVFERLGMLVPRRKKRNEMNKKNSHTCESLVALRITCRQGRPAESVSLGAECHPAEPEFLEMDCHERADKTAPGSRNREPSQGVGGVAHAHHHNFCELQGLSLARGHVRPICCREWTQKRD